MARSKILHEAEALLMKEQPIAPFLTQADLWLVSDKVKVGRITPSTRISSCDVSE